MIDEFCKDIMNHTPAFCERVSKRVPVAFCELVCRGEWEKYRRKRLEPSTRTIAAPLTKPVIDKAQLTSEQKTNPELVSVIIPCDEGDAQYLEKTIKSARENAIGLIEIIVFCDGWYPIVDYPNVIIVKSLKRVGMRRAMNYTIQDISKGKYIVKLDAHCAMTPEWDARMKASCGEKTLVAPAIDRLDEETWTGNGIDMSFATLDGNLRMQYIRPWARIDQCPLEQEIICSTWCCFMIRKDHYLELGGCDESLGMWGASSPEWSLKTWLTGGRMILRTDVVCSHLFREKTPFTVDLIKQENAFRRLCEQWILKKDNPLKQTRDASWLVTHFSYMNDYDIPLFGLGGNGFTIRNEDWEFLKDFIEKNDIKTVLEIGSGKSTLMFDQLGLQVVSIETIPLIRETVKALASNNVIMIEMKRYSGNYGYDLIFIDGPAGGENRESSYEYASCKTGTRFIACHDAHRFWENKWIEKYLSGCKEVAVMSDGVIRIFENATVPIQV